MDVVKALTVPLSELNVFDIEEKIYKVAQTQIDNEGTLTGPERLAHIRYRELNLLKRFDTMSFITKAIVIHAIEEHALWSTLEGYKTPEQAAEVEANITPTEYSNIKTLWEDVVPLLVKTGYSVEDLLYKKGSNLRLAIPILRRIAAKNFTDSERINKRYDQIRDDVTKIAKSQGKKLTEDEIQTNMVDKIMTTMDDSWHSFYKSLDPYSPENSKEEVEEKPQCIVIRKNGDSFLLIEANNDGINGLLPVLTKHCTIDFVMHGDNPKAYKPIQNLLKFIETMKNGIHLS